MLKKTALILTALFLSGSALAADPTFTFGAKKADSVNGPWLSDGHVYLKSDNNRQFCWELKQLPETMQPMKFTLIITSPNKATFHFNTATSADKTQHEFTFSATPDNGRIINCWKFDHADPIGEYSLKLISDTAEYPLQRFELKP